MRIGPYVIHITLFQFAEVRVYAILSLVKTFRGQVMFFKYGKSLARNSPGIGFKFFDGRGNLIADRKKIPGRKLAEVFQMDLSVLFQKITCEFSEVVLDVPVLFLIG